MQQTEHTALFKLKGETQIHRVMEVDGMNYSRAREYFKRIAQNMADKNQCEVFWDFYYEGEREEKLLGFLEVPSNWVLADVAM